MLNCAVTLTHQAKHEVKVLRMDYLKTFLNEIPVGLFVDCIMIAISKNTGRKCLLKSDEDTARSYPRPFAWQGYRHDNRDERMITGTA